MTCFECARPVYAMGVCKTHYNKARGYGVKKQSAAQCKRCGVVRQVQNLQRARPLCKDCKWVLSPEERVAWDDEVKVAA